jgi:hypothetical protein
MKTGVFGPIRQLDQTRDLRANSAFISDPKSLLLAFAGYGLGGAEGELKNYSSFVVILISVSYTPVS